MYAKPQLKEVALDAESSYCCQAITIDLRQDTQGGMDEVVEGLLAEGGIYANVADPARVTGALGDPLPHGQIGLPTQLACFNVFY